MIVGMGMDVVAIERFRHFSRYSPRILQKIYAPEELAYCLAVPAKSAERFAARFAAKEALYKALCQATAQKIPFFLLCQKSSLSLAPAPTMFVEWSALNSEPLRVLTTITHTTTEAFVVVVLQEN